MSPIWSKGWNDKKMGKILPDVGPTFSGQFLKQSRSRTIALITGVRLQKESGKKKDTQQITVPNHPDWTSGSSLNSSYSLAAASKQMSIFGDSAVSHGSLPSSHLPLDAHHSLKPTLILGSITDFRQEGLQQSWPNTLHLTSSQSLTLISGSQS